MIEVLAPGLLTTVQDRGRRGQGAYGISPGGAADSLALRVANLVVGNDEGAAALEITLVGPHLRFEHRAIVALAGARLGATIDGVAVPPGEAIEIAAGAELRWAGGPAGARACLAVAGGIEVPEILGSRSTDLRGRFGGLDGRPLKRGDRLVVGATPRGPRAIPPALRDRLFARRDTLRIVPGADRDRFDEEAARRFADASFAVRDDSDRMALRLAGLPVTSASPIEKVSEGMVAGAIQVPPSGAPIVLGVDHPSTGGYPLLAAVIAADLPSLAQLRPRQGVRFDWIGIDAARQALRETEALLAKLAAV